MTASVLQTVANTAASGSATTLTQAITVSQGSTLHICVTCNNNFSISSVTDGSNTYNLLDAFNATTGSRRVSHYAAYNVSAGSYTVSANYSGSVDARFIGIKEIGGVKAAPLDKNTGQIQATPTTTTDATTSGNTATLSTQPALVSGWCISTQYGGAADTEGTGYTLESKAAFASGGMYYVAENKRVTATTAVAATFTSAANFEHVSVVAVFDEQTLNYVNLERSQRGINRGVIRG